MRSTQIRGIRWSYEESGDGPSVLLLHGTLGSHKMFDPLVDVLSARFRCIAVDWPGHGESGFDEHGWTSDDLVAGVVELIESLDLGPVTLIGLSQGGAVALRVTLARPNVVTALVTMSAGPDGPAAPALESMKKLGQLLCDGSDDERLAALRAQQLAFHTPGWVDAEPEAAQREIDVMSAHDRRAMPAVTRVPATYESVESRLAEITQPTLVIWGVDDVRAGLGPTMVDAIPRSRLATIPNAGHHLMHDAPGAVIDEVTNFLAETVSSGAVVSR